MSVDYATQPLDAFMAAQTSVGLVLGAVVWSRPLRPWYATGLLLVAVGVAVTAPVAGWYLQAVGAHPPQVKTMLLTAGVLAVMAVAATRRWKLAACGVAMLALLWPITRYIKDSDSELAAAYVAAFGLLIGLHWRWSLGETPTPIRTSEKPLPEWKDDAAVFGAATLAAALVCRVLLHGQTASADEWAYTYQAALFAKLHAYGAVPACPDAFRSFWVFYWMGRSFAQYTPGWPYFMTPFEAVGAAWLAGPASLGLLAAGACRLARRAAAGYSPGEQGATRAEQRAAGLLAAAVITFSTTTLINGASRYPHVFEAALFAWALEALLTLAAGEVSSRRQYAWGTVLGTSTALMLAVRPGDGVALGTGLFVYFVTVLLRGRLPWRSLASAVAAFALLGALTLVILRLQIGRWFTTGYSLTQTFYPWLTAGFSVPAANEYRYGIPLAVGAYAWWPCAPALGLAGIATLRGRAKPIALVLIVSGVSFLGLYAMAEYGRGLNFGYGPRFHVPLVVPMGVGSGVVLARFWTAAWARRGDVAAIHAGGPAAVALVALLLGVVRVAPLVLPVAYSDAHTHNLLNDALAKADLRNALVLGWRGLNRTDPRDLPENLPMELYPHQAVLIGIEPDPQTVSCIRENYPNRKLYRALPGDPARIAPY
ncbi:MAG: hypothetical protein ABTD50_13780 [Polyangiaceae bacterium]|jgi:hypothetical protein